MEKPQPQPTDLQMLMAKHSRRKVESIVQKAYDAFIKASEEYGSLSADELVMAGLNLFMNVTVAPLERMTENPYRMRCELAKQLEQMVKRGTEDGN